MTAQNPDLIIFGLCRILLFDTYTVTRNQCNKKYKNKNKTKNTSTMRYMSINKCLGSTFLPLFICIIDAVISIMTFHSRRVEGRKCRRCRVLRRSVDFMRRKVSTFTNSVDDKGITGL